jgi:hypothetical protein
MAEILGVPVTKKVVAVAVVSVPLALAVGAGYLLFRGGRAMRKRLWQESEEEQVRRLEQTYRQYPPDTD